MVMVVHRRLNRDRGAPIPCSLPARKAGATDEGRNVQAPLLFLAVQAPRGKSRRACGHSRPVLLVDVLVIRALVFGVCFRAIWRNSLERRLSDHLALRSAGKPGISRRWTSMVMGR